MSLTAASTRDDALAQYRNSLGYESDASGATARDFVAAIRFLLTLPVRSRGAGGAETQYDPTALRQQLSQAEQYLRSATAANVTAAPPSTPRQFSMERYQP